MPQLELNGAALYYETDGHVSTPAVLLIHAGIANLRMWDTLVPALADDHFVIRYDTRGFGATTTDDVEFSDRADACALLDHLGVASTTVLGCSRGGGIAIDLTIERPDRVRGLITVGAGPSGFPDLEPTPREHAILDRMDGAFAAQDWALLNELEVRLWAIGPDRDPSALDPAFVDLAYELNRANLDRVHDSPTPIELDPPAYDRLVDIEVPALITVGDHDLTEELAAFEYLRSTIPQVDSARFTNSAHLPSVEQSEQFNRLIAGWLAERSL